MSAARATSAENGDESIEDIKGSLDRIEELLTRGHQLLYGEEDAEGGDDPLSPITPEEQPVPSPAPRATAAPSASAATANMNSSNSRSGASGVPPRPSANRSVKTVSQPAALPPASTKKESKTPKREQLSVSRGSRGAANSSQRRRTRATSLGDSAGIYESAARIRETRAEGLPPPNLEEGVDEDDVAQDVSIAELKARIHRELEEYRQHGPLMKRRKSVRREERLKSRNSAPPPRKTQVHKEAREENDAVAEHHPLWSTPAKKKASTAPKRTPPAPHASAAATTSAPVSLPASKTKSRAAPSATASGSNQLPASRTAARPVVWRLPATKQQQQQQQQTRAAEKPKAAAEPAAPPARLSIWERLYSDAAAQQEKRERKREQARIEQESRQATPATNYNRRVRASMGAKRAPAARVSAARKVERSTYPTEKPSASVKAKGKASSAAAKATTPPAGASHTSASAKEFQPLGMGDETPEDFSRDNSPQATPVSQKKTRVTDSTPSVTKAAHSQNGSCAVDDVTPNGEAANLDDSTQVPPAVTPLDFRSLKK